VGAPVQGIPKLLVTPEKVDWLLNSGQPLMVLKKVFFGAVLPQLVKCGWSSEGSRTSTTTFYYSRPGARWRPRAPAPQPISYCKWNRAGGGGLWPAIPVVAPSAPSQPVC
jgi:hypothetical protein